MPELHQYRTLRATRLRLWWLDLRHYLQYTRRSAPQEHANWRQVRILIIRWFQYPVASATSERHMIQMIHLASKKAQLSLLLSVAALLSTPRSLQAQQPDRAWLRKVRIAAY